MEVCGEATAIQTLKPRLPRGNLSTRPIFAGDFHNGSNAKRFGSVLAVLHKMGFKGKVWEQCRTLQYGYMERPLAPLPASRK
jgi:hypothetical protein